jgi:O-antigen ligase
VLLFLEPSPRRLLRTLAATAPAIALVVWLGNRSRLADSSASPSHRTALVLAGVAVLCAAAAGAAAILAGRRVRPAEPPPPRRLALAVLVCAALAGAVAVGVAGSSQPRVSYWSVAWHDEYLAHPVLGSGAGTFGRFWAISGQEAIRGGGLDAHSLYVEMLAELGPAGLLLLAALLLLPLRGLTRRTAPGLPAAAGAYVAFLVHAGVDWDWEMPAVVLAGLSCGAAVLLAGRDDPAPLRPRARAVALAAALVLGACALVGLRSHAVPGASGRAKAPTSGAFALLGMRKG